MHFSLPKSPEFSEETNKKLVAQALEQPNLSFEELQYIQAVNMLQHVENWFEVQHDQFTQKNAMTMATHRHYKGGLYRYLGTTICSETRESRVIYAHLWPYRCEIFDRPATLFFGDHDGKKRFEVLSDERKRYYLIAQYHVCSSMSEGLGGLPAYWNQDRGWVQGTRAARFATRYYSETAQQAAKGTVTQPKRDDAIWELIIPNVGVASTKT